MPPARAPTPQFSQPRPGHSQASTSNPAAATSTSMPPELYAFISSQFATLSAQFNSFQSSMEDMSNRFDMRLARLENRMESKFLQQEEHADHAASKFNRLVGTSGDVSTHTSLLQTRLHNELQRMENQLRQGNTLHRESITEIQKVRLSYAHPVDRMDSLAQDYAFLRQHATELRAEFHAMWKLGHEDTSTAESSYRRSTSALASAIPSELDQCINYVSDVLHNLSDTMDFADSRYWKEQSRTNCST